MSSSPRTSARTSLLHWRIRDRAEQLPERTAVELRGERLSYSELMGYGLRLARVLREAGVRPGDRVCLLAPKTPSTFVGIIGILASGAAYVPLDPGSPPARLRKIVASCDDRWILGSGPVGGRLSEVLHQIEPARDWRIGWLDASPDGAPADFPLRFTWADVEQSPEAADLPNLPDSACAYIMFTSGSTGTPKGVTITHANVHAFASWLCEYCGIRSDDRLSGHPPLHFDLSTLDIYGAFYAGAALCVVPPEASLIPQRLADFIRDAELTQWCSVPSVLKYMAGYNVIEHGDFPALRRVLWCGEVFPTPQLIHWMQRLPHAKFVNLYGPTEATVASSYYTIPACPADEQEPIPIGTACSGEELLVLDDALRPAPTGVVGNLCIGGVGLSPGYWRDAERTRAVFVKYTDDSGRSRRIYVTGDLARIGEADGQVYFCGRSDTQIKSRGYRIELGEIEAALEGIDGIAECAVVALPTEGFAGHEICCAYALRPDVTVTASAIRAALAAQVPEYMVPRRWAGFDALPKNDNGKTDRPALKDYFVASAVSAVPPSGHEVGERP